MPKKVRIFQRDTPGELQEAINTWLTENTEINIEHVTQSQVQHGQRMQMPITVCIWYFERG